LFTGGLRLRRFFDASMIVGLGADHLPQTPWRP
jgi:hypothetical protein